MTDALDVIREAVKLLPAVEERQEDGATVFVVAGEPFVRVGDSVSVRGDHGWTPLAYDDTAMLDDAVAHGWELAAPRALLEAGGR